MSSQDSKIKYSIIVILMVIVFATIFFVKLNTGSDRPKENYPISEYTNPSRRARIEGISPKEAQLKNYREFRGEFPSAQFDGKTFHLLAFPQSVGTHVPKNYPNERYGNRGGVMIFESDQKVWESKEFLENISQEQTKFKDLTGDGTPEIVTVDTGAGNQPSCVFYVYKWDGLQFNLITPLPPEYIDPCYGSHPEKGGIRDIDQDGVFELITFNYDDPANGRGENGLIYKFNDSKYYLWKKISESSPEFKKLFQ